jgi:protein-S-isoprenylcysteine O-methyltransferase Ste14
MSLAISIPQAALAATILASGVGTYIALSPPNPVSKSVPTTGDWIRWVNLTHRHTTKVTLAPLGLLALHTSTFACLYPSIPSFVLRHAAENGLNRSLITWSPETSIPLCLIICAGIPLRLVSYASLGKNFTFALAEPDRLKTTGIYRYVQHPSYTGLVILILANILLLGRTDGVLSCWISPSWYESIRFLRWISTPIAWRMDTG